jgi:hypothetical protein
MPIEHEHKLNLPTFTVFSAAAKASTPVCRMSSARTGWVKPEGARVALQVHDVVDQVVVLVLAVAGKEDVAVGPVDVTASSDTDTMLATLPLPM